MRVRIEISNSIFQRFDIEKKRAFKIFEFFLAVHC